MFYKIIISCVLFSGAVCAGEPEVTPQSAVTQRLQQHAKLYGKQAASDAALSELTEFVQVHPILRVRNYLEYLGETGNAAALPVMEKIMRTDVRIGSNVRYKFCQNIEPASKAWFQIRQRLCTSQAEKKDLFMLVLDETRRDFNIEIRTFLSESLISNLPHSRSIVMDFLGSEHAFTPRSEPSAIVLLNLLNDVHEFKLSSEEEDRVLNKGGELGIFVVGHSLARRELYEKAEEVFLSAYAKSDKLYLKASSMNYLNFKESRVFGFLDEQLKQLNRAEITELTEHYRFEVAKSVGYLAEKAVSPVRERAVKLLIRLLEDDRVPPQNIGNETEGIWYLRAADGVIATRKQWREFAEEKLKNQK